MIPAAFEAPPPRPPRPGPRRRLGLRTYRPQPRARRDGPVVVRLWIPLILVWVLLAPFVILLSPFLIIGLAALRLDPFRAIGAAMAILHSLGGAQVDVDAPDAFVKIHLI